VIGPFVGGGLFYYVALSATTSWTATFMMRAYHLTLAQIAGPLGLMTFLAGAAGYLLAGVLVDSAFVRRHGGKSALLVLVPLVALPAPLAVFCSSPYLALLALSAFTIATPLLNVASNGSMQDLMPNAMRGFAITLFGAAGGLLSVSLGPLLVALVTERVFGHDDFIGYALAAVGIPALLGAALCFGVSRRELRRALAQGGELSRVVASSR
jgi:MFS family permease